MSLNKVRVGDLIHFIDIRNSGGISNVLGINNKKEFIPSQAGIDSLDRTKYKMIEKDQFVFSGMQTGRDRCIRIGLYKSDEPACVSPAYSVFAVNNLDEILPDYLFMYFNSNEKDRRGWFLSDASIRSNLDLDRFCSIELEIPPLYIQRKFVNVYKSLKSKQQAIQNELSSLESTYKSMLMASISIGKEKGLKHLTTLIDLRNTNNLYKIDDVIGVANTKEFITTKVDVSSRDLRKFKIVEQDTFVFNHRTSRNGSKFSISLNLKKETKICTEDYTTFQLSDEGKRVLLPEWLFLYMSRAEFDRYVITNSWGSSTEFFNYSDIENVKLPIPTLQTQHAVVEIYKIYCQKKEVIEKLNSLIKQICPVLIKGSIEEARETC